MCKHCEQFSQNRRGFLRTVVGGIIGAAGVLVLGSSATAGLKLTVPTKTQPSSCRTCGGSGQVLGTCAMCNGKGKSTTGNTCQGCGGSGQRYKFCSTCGGSGQVNAGSTTDNDWLRDKTLVAEATCGLACIDKDGGCCAHRRITRGSITARRGTASEPLLAALALTETSSWMLKVRADTYPPPARRAASDTIPRSRFGPVSHWPEA